MSSKPTTERAVGIIDGVNRVFDATATYISGTVYVYLNGQLQQKNFVSELGGTQVELEYAPELGDIVHLRYLSVC